MDHLCALQRDFINLRLGTFIHWNSAAVQFHANPDIIDWEFDLENGGEPRRYPFPESDWAPRAPDCDRWAQIAKSAGCRFAVLTAKHHEGFALWPVRIWEPQRRAGHGPYGHRRGIPAGLPRSRSAGRPVLLRARPDGRDRAALLSPCAARARARADHGAADELRRDTLSYYRRLERPVGRPSYRELPVRGSRCPRQAPAAELPAHEHRLHGGHLRHGRRLLRKRRPGRS